MAFFDVLTDGWLNFRTNQKLADFGTIDAQDPRCGEKALKILATLSPRELDRAEDMKNGGIQAACHYVAFHAAAIEAPAVRRALQTIEIYARRACERHGHVELLREGDAETNYEVACYLTLKLASPEWQAEKGRQAFMMAAETEDLSQMPKAVLETALAWQKASPMAEIRTDKTGRRIETVLIAEAEAESREAELRAARRQEMILLLKSAMKPKMRPIIETEADESSALAGETSTMSWKELMASLRRGAPQLRM